MSAFELPAPDRSSRRHPGAAVHRLTRALCRVTGRQPVCSTTIEAFVRAVPSRMAALAVPTADNLLAIAATHGYPLELVEDIRFSPGEEIIGHVYRQPTPLRVDDIGAFRPRRPSRPRYRTPSFVALPISAGGTVLGVACLADRLDGGPFTQRDVSVLQALAGPASLALSGEHAREQAVTYAHAAAIDPLSGLFNRRHLQQRLEEELQRAQRQGSLVGLLMLDIDDFKRINDRHGHVVGDEVIRDVADILRNSVRRFDVCARFGGEEFAVVMPGSSPQSAAGVAERIRQRIEAHRLKSAELADLCITASIGLSVSGDASARDLVNRADQALYSAKRSGKNRVVDSSALVAGAPRALPR